jgi:pimeloyl-ACP methyl ester carboxylesterase
MNFRRYLLLAAVLICVSQISVASVKLKRTSFLGLIPETAEAGEAVVVQNLHPLGSAQALGLKVGDRISSINSREIEDFSSLVTALVEVNEGERLNLIVIRGEQSVPLSAKAQGRPREKGQGFSVQYSQFEWQREHIRTISYHPEKPRKDGAAVLFIQGYTCGSIDYGMMPNVSLNLLLGSFAQAGFTVMKMEKPDVGDSEGELDCRQYDFVTENKAFLAGLEHLKSQPKVKASNVFVFGHSLGVLHSAIIAEQGLTKGVIGYGGVVKSWVDYLHDIYAKQSVKYWGVDEKQAKQNVTTISPFLKMWLAADTPWKEVLASQAAKRVIAADLVAINNEQIMDRHYSFFRSINRYDFESLWGNANSHALMLHGKYDIQAIEGNWAKDIATLVNKNEGVTGKALTFEQTDHNLLKFANKSDLMTFTRGQANDLGEFNQRIATQSVEWMENILKQQTTASTSK